MKASALVVALCAVARADTPVDRPEAFDADRDVPPPGQAELGFDGGAPITTWAASVQLGYLDRPLSLHTKEIETFPVRRRETVALGGAVAIGESFLVDARLPLAHQVGDRLRELSDTRPLDRWVPGDLSLGARMRLANLDELSVFARANVTLGTGDDYDFAGEARLTAAWMLIGRFRLPAGIVVAATTGVRFRAAEVIVADRLLGDELFGGAGATYELPAVPGLWCEANHMRVAGELVGVLGNHVAGERGPSPVEARLGFVGQVRPWLSFAVRVGKGLDDQLGSPRFRALFELVYNRKWSGHWDAE